MFVFVPQVAGHTHNSMSYPTGDGGSQPLSQTPDAQPPDTSFKVNGVTVQPIGAGTKRKKKTPSNWKHVVEFTPATRDGKNVKCMVKIPFPAVDNVPAREMTCGFLMKYVRANPSKGIAAGGIGY